MRRIARAAVVLLGLGLAGCAQGVPFNEAAADLPPPAPGTARIFVYREPALYQGLAWVPVFVNGARIGAVGPGQVISHDVPAPGPYVIAVASEGLWPSQDKTVAVEPGQTVYAKIGTIKGLNPTADRPVPQNTYVVMLEDPSTARREIGPLTYRAAG